MAVTGLAPPAGGRDVWGGAGWAVEVFDDGADDRKAPLEGKNPNNPSPSLQIFKFLPMLHCKKGY